MSEPPVDPPQRPWCEDCDMEMLDCNCKFYWEDLYAAINYERSRLGE
jgi:hypothetical protein